MKAKPSSNLHVLVIDNGDGLTSSIHRTHEGATAALYQYVSDNWGDMDPDFGALPTDMQEAIDLYFGDEGAGSNDSERADISPCEIED